MQVDTVNIENFNCKTKNKQKQIKDQGSQKQSEGQGS